MAQDVLTIVGYAIAGPVGAAVGPLMGRTVELRATPETPDRAKPLAQSESEDTGKSQPRTASPVHDT